MDIYLYIFFFVCLDISGIHSSQLFNSTWKFGQESSSNIVFTGGFWGCSIRSRTVFIAIDMFFARLSNTSLPKIELFTDFELRPMAIAAIQPNMRKLSLLKYRFGLVLSFWWKFIFKSLSMSSSIWNIIRIISYTIFDSLSFMIHFSHKKPYR